MAGVCKHVGWGELHLCSSQGTNNILRSHEHLRAIRHGFALEWYAQLRHMLLDEKQEDCQHRSTPSIEEQPPLHLLRGAAIYDV